jgi:hypothetical protein
MIDKIINKKKIDVNDNEDIRFWIAKTPEERLSAVEMLRRDYWGADYTDQSGFPRVYKIVKHASR